MILFNRNKIFCLLLILVSASGCDNQQDRLVTDLTSNGYLYYFTNPNGIETRDSLLSDSGTMETLKRIVSDSEVNSTTRFVAAEILLHDSAQDFNDPGMNAIISKIYTSNFTNARFAEGKAENIWMYPCYTDDTIGDRVMVLNPGSHLLALGEDAIPGLKVQLTDTTRLYISMGSKREIFSDSLQYRVKDLAAFFICRIRGWQFNSCLSPEERDAEIEAIKQKLN